MKLRALALGTALLAASVPAVSSSAEAAPWGFHGGGWYGGWGGGGHGGGWGWGGLGLGLAAGAIIGSALAAPYGYYDAYPYDDYYGYGYAPAVTYGYGYGYRATDMDTGAMAIASAVTDRWGVTGTLHTIGAKRVLIK